LVVAANQRRPLLVPAMYKHRSRRSAILPFSKVTFYILQIMFAYLLLISSIVWQRLSHGCEEHFTLPRK